MEKSAVVAAPERFAQIQQSYIQQLAGVMSSRERVQELIQKDRRFSSEAWKGNEAFATMAALYLINSQALTQMAEAFEGDHKTQEKVRFLTQQFVDAASPANYLATNPDAQKRIIETKGASLRVGIDNLMHDLERGRITQTDETAFEVGKNIATTEGSVIFRNDLIEVIHYKPRTPKVGQRPLLLVPPSINKFYIMDLQPGSSLVEFSLDQGHNVFLVSWRNVGTEQGNLTWDDYIKLGVLEAIRVTLAASGSKDLNLLGFCVGGTLVTTACAVLAARGDTSVHSLTLMTTLLDFSETGVLDVFIDEQHVAMREATIGSGGLLSGRDLASTFSMLRPNDLVWNYVVRNYLKGEAPPAFDILFWNADSTNLPGPFYCWYLRNTYLENNLVKPGHVRVAGQKIDLRQIKLPVYAFGAQEDHIVPWESAWASAKALVGCKTRFVLGASGHVAGAINPASKNKRSYWTASTSAMGTSPLAWLSKTKEQPGSWWNDWAHWLSAHKGGEIPASKKLGARGFPVLEPAPGSYVKVRLA